MAVLDHRKAWEFSHSGVRFAMRRMQKYCNYYTANIAPMEPSNRAGLRISALSVLIAAGCFGTQLL